MNKVAYNKGLLALIVAGPVVGVAIGVAVMRGRAPAPPAPIAAGALRGANVLLVTIDTLRADHVGVYGSAGSLTPTIDQFATEGLRVRRDSPFEGALVPLDRYRTDLRVASVMVEVRRGLYCDETTGETIAAFEGVRAAIERAVLTAGVIDGSWAS